VLNLLRLLVCMDDGRLPRACFGGCLAPALQLSRAVLMMSKASPSSAPRPGRLRGIGPERYVRVDARIHEDVYDRLTVDPFWMRLILRCVLPAARSRSRVTSARAIRSDAPRTPRHPYPMCVMSPIDCAPRSAESQERACQRRRISRGDQR